MLVFGFLFLSLEANVYTPKNRFPQSSLHARVAVRLDSKPSTFLGVRDRRVKVCAVGIIYIFLPLKGSGEASEGLKPFNR